MSTFNVYVDETVSKVIVNEDTQSIIVQHVGVGGTSDHGELDGLADDDHTQYHNTSRANTWLATKSTTDLAEGSNLYYTDERVDDRVNALLQEGSNITLTYDDNLNTLTIDASAGGAGDSFSTIVTDSGTNPVATGTDTLTITTDDPGVATFVGDATADTVTLTFTYTPENVANKATDTALGTSDTLYPSQNAVKTYADAKVADEINNGTTTIAPSQNAVFDALALKEDLSNKSTDVNLGSSNTLYPSQLAVKTYVDAVAAGLSWKTAVATSTTAGLPANTYNNGTAGVGATITADANGALGTIGGVATTTSMRILVKDEAGSDAPNNGIYEVTQVGDGSNPFILTRVTDCDTPAELESATVVVSGGTNADTVYRQSAMSITVGTTDITWVNLFSVNALVEGDGIDITANAINLDIPDLTAETTIDDADLISIYDSSAGAHRKMTKANFVLGLGGGSIGTQTLSDGANISWDLDDGHGIVTLGGNRTLDNPTNQVAGQTYIIKVIQDGTGSRTLSWGTSYLWTDAQDPVLSTGAADVDVFIFWSDGTNMYGTPLGFNFG